MGGVSFVFLFVNNDHGTTGKSKRRVVEMIRSFFFDVVRFG